MGMYRANFQANLTWCARPDCCAFALHEILDTVKAYSEASDHLRS